MFSEIDVFRLQKYFSAPIGNENLRLKKKKDVVDGTIYLVCLNEAINPISVQTDQNF